ncbi:MAG: UDP-N-acetylmuramate dehydrogenase [Lewinellaceae bacterium]|nr:UDP-N-acetylmuramate dehydrogenase [Lewinellaceae bacterium]
MTVRENVSLLPYNTFGIAVEAACFAEVASVDELRTALRSNKLPVLVLGSGSNILFSKDADALVLKNSIRGIEVVRRFSRKVWVKAGGGEVWHDFVLWAIGQGLGGVENLSLIPGTVGAAPVQNIGAYGVELKDVFVKLEALDLETGAIRHFSKAECRFGYRDSIFKREAKGRYCITSVTLSLTQKDHRIHLTYGDIKKTLEAEGIEKPGIADISRAVIRIRSSKLPDPAVIGNCGSFFKNPEVKREIMERIRERYPQLPFYELPNRPTHVKVPAGWLIEQCGWKGKRVGNTGCYEKQALVLVNYGGATGEEVKKLAYAIIDSVEQALGIRLEPEVNIL